MSDWDDIDAEIAAEKKANGSVSSILQCKEIAHASKWLKDNCGKTYKEQKGTCGQYFGSERVAKAFEKAYRFLLDSGRSGLIAAAPRNMLLFGPPGTGKTSLVAHGIWRLMQATPGKRVQVIQVNAGGLIDGRAGQTQKNIKALYACAKAAAEAGSNWCHVVLWIDEVEGILGSRKRSDANDLSGLGTEQWLIEATAMANRNERVRGSEKQSEGYVITWAATNAVNRLDPAVIARFGVPIFVGYADYDGAVRAVDHRFDTLLERINSVLKLSATEAGNVKEELRKATVPGYAQGSVSAQGLALEKAVLEQGFSPQQAASKAYYLAEHGDLMGNWGFARRDLDNALTDAFTDWEESHATNGTEFTPQSLAHFFRLALKRASDIRRATGITAVSYVQQMLGAMVTKEELESLFAAPVRVSMDSTGLGTAMNALQITQHGETGFVGASSVGGTWRLDACGRCRKVRSTCSC